MEQLPRNNSVLVLNTRLLKIDDPVIKKALSSGTPCLFLPRDSPDWNPLKQAVSSIKTGITGAHKLLGEAEDKAGVESIVFYHVYDAAKEHAENWFRECGYT
ncbi:hypothetical protein BDV93DRAFT_359012 [Ceratobasidium sp. AG-I]|nr:hypothetical protein BDV93DRAFT_359012 [Ceratobasidium sp. AG-I]